jgi:hypothetical protein
VTVTAAAAGTRQLDDLTVNRLGFGAMRLTGGAVFGRAAPGDRDRSISVLRRARRDSGPAVPARRRCHRSPGRSSPALRASQGAGGTSGRGVRAAPCPRAAAGRGWLSCSRIYPVKG